MLSPQHKKRLFTLRALIFLLFISLMARLAIIQLVHHDFYQQHANNQYSLTIKEIPPRASIYDRHQKPIALNTQRLAAFITPKKLEEKEKLLSFLKKHFPQAHQRFAAQQENNFMYIKRKLSDQEVDLITAAHLKDVYLLEEPQRYYPNRTLQPLLGLTGIDNEGLSGLELVYDKQLRGAPTTYHIEREARSRGYYFKKALQQEGQQGTSLITTIDSTLQALVYEEVKASVEEWHSQEGAALIMDPTNGDIITCVTYPCGSEKSVDELTDDDLRNRAITDVYELGSVMKIFPALAALEEKVVEPDEPIDCENKKIIHMKRVKFSTWKAHGILPYRHVVALSNNIGTSKVAERLGKKLYDYLKRCGFGQKTGIAFPGEAPGYINPPEKWTTQSPFSLSFGYEISATLLQLAQAFAMIAQKGILVKPRLSLQEPIIRSPLPLFSTETIDVIYDILERTIYEGTAHRAQIKNYTVRGKTGTANLLVNGQYDSNRNIFTFAGIVEKGAYQRVIITFIKESTIKNIYSSSVSVPLFERIAQKTLIHEKIL